MIKRIPLTTFTRYPLIDHSVTPAPETLPALDAAAAQTVSIPDVWNKDEPAKTGYVPYATTFTVDAVTADTRVYVECDAVFGAAQVFVNGQFAGTHRGGYSRFRVDVTRFCKAGSNDLVITADNHRYDDINALGGDFSNYGGMYRPVSILVAEGPHFNQLHYGTSGVDITTYAEGRIEADIWLTGSTGSESVLLILRDKDETVAEFDIPVTEADEDGCLCADIEIENPHLWNGKKDPYLYELSVLITAGDHILDQTTAKIGFRDIKLTADKGLFLNGEHLRINGVAKHQDYEGVGPGTTSEHLHRDMELIKEIGANGIRLSHYQHPDEMYDLCDEEGMLVWAEIPLLMLPDDNDGVFENAKEQLKELIYQNRHHPAIFCWGIQNEIALMGETSQQYEKIPVLNTLAKELDPSRPTACANLNQVLNDSPLNKMTDMVGYNLYYGWYYGEMPDYRQFFEKFHAENPSVPLGISEYGVDCSLTWHSATPKRKDYTEEYQTLFHKTVYPIMEAQDFLWGTFIWNMFDFGSAIRNEGGVKGKNCKGLVTWDRQTRKDAFYYYKAAWSEEPFVHIAENRFAKRSGDAMTITVLSNQPTVALTVNGTAYASQNGCRVFTFENVPLPETGLLAVTATAGNCTDSATFEKVAEPCKDYIYVDPNPSIDVSNWFIPQDRYSILDTMDVLHENPACWAVLEEMVPEITNDPRQQKPSRMQLLQILNWMRAVYKEDHVKKLNEKLGTIAKQ
ncbi:MAG: hypothetical protein MJ178_10640 [Treponemataceae bacterium]|nr:hypothetical protein [Treponemataceae bacterium]